MEIKRLWCYLKSGMLFNCYHYATFKNVFLLQISQQSKIIPRQKQTMWVVWITTAYFMKITNHIAYIRIYLRKLIA